MTRITLSTLLIAAGVALVVGPAMFPVQPVLTHQTYPTTTSGLDELRQQGYEVVAYENLSERGQELYVQTLENGGRYSAPEGEGAPEFRYPTSEDLAAADGFEGMEAMRAIVIERPEDDDHLPPSDEQVHHVPFDHREGGEHEPSPTEPSPTGASPTGSEAGSPTPTVPGTDTPPPERSDETRQTEPHRPPEVDEEQIRRYDMMYTQTEMPPLDHRSNLLRLLSIVSGVLAVGLGGYRQARP